MSFMADAEAIGDGHQKAVARIAQAQAGVGRSKLFQTVRHRGSNLRLHRGSIRDDVDLRPVFLLGPLPQLDPGSRSAEYGALGIASAFRSEERRGGKEGRC